MKLGSLPIILIGAAVGLIALFYGLFHSWIPRSEEITNKEKELGDLRDQNAMASRVDQKVEEAKAQVVEAANQWQRYVATKTPPTSVERGGISLAVNAYYLTVDSRRFRDSIQRAVNTQSKRGGVRVVSGLTVPQPSQDAGEILNEFYNFPAFPFPFVLFELGSITVEGTYAQIMANVRSWSTMPNWLAVASDLQISGTSPRLQGTYNVVLLGYIRGNVIGPPAVDAPTGATNANANLPAGPEGR